MTEVRDYKDLTVWQKSMDLAEMIYRLTEKFPAKEMYELTKQIRRAAVSVPSNLAEGRGRQTSNEFRHFLSTARGSLHEVETQLLLAMRFGYVDTAQTRPTFELLEEISRMIHGLSRALPGSRVNR